MTRTATRRPTRGAIYLKSAVGSMALLMGVSNAITNRLIASVDANTRALDAVARALTKRARR